MAVVALEIPARPAYLSLVRLVVDAAVGSLAPGLGGARLDDLKLAVTEACSNAIEANQSAWSDAPVVLRCELDDTTVTVEVADRGGGFDPHGITSLPSATDPTRLRYESGLGIPLMKTLTDEIVFVPGPDGTTVRLTVYRPEAT
ncbi:MAG: ATP-binding protein [Acidimicrobiales bacterium]